MPEIQGKKDRSPGWTEQGPRRAERPAPSQVRSGSLGLPEWLRLGQRNELGLF